MKKSFLILFLIANSSLSFAQEVPFKQVLIVACSYSESKEADKITGSSKEENLYLGLKPPGLTPELFAPGIVSTNNLEIQGAFSPGMDDFYFTRQKRGELSKTYTMKIKNGVWDKFKEEPYSGEVFISTDGNTMYLGNTYKEQTSTGWSEEKNLGTPFEQFEIMRLTSSSYGTIVFDVRDSIGTIRSSRLINDKYVESKILTDMINTGTYTSHPFIAPDESYLIWDSIREGGYGDSDLYISFCQKDGTWGTAINMGKEINSHMEDAYGSMTPDGKYFLFHRIKLGESIEDSYANIFWVDAQIIETLRPKHQE